MNDYEDLAPDGTPQELVVMPDPRRNWHPKRKGHQPKYIRTISVSWFVELSKLPGKIPLLIGMAVQYRTGIAKTRTVTLNRRTRELFGLQHHHVSRGVALLEQAGLIRVRREPGRLALITLLDVDPKT